ncbi:hypothetical protein MPSEU_000068400 [Mayamaea pseudoterrestris]|nr:hypothetical protein MPSEU_000068400 [Mayamaea pseudoterrestris]
MTICILPVAPGFLLLLLTSAALGCSSHHDRPALRGNSGGHGDGRMLDYGSNNSNHTASSHLHVTKQLRSLAKSTSYLCGSQSPTDELKINMGVAVSDWKKANEANRRNLASVQYTIKVAVHVIYDASKGYVSQSDIQSGYMTALQKGFSNTPFNFTLAQVTYTENTDWYDCSAGNEQNFKQSLRVPGRNVLNVYLCDPWSNFGEYGSYGWSSFPNNAGTNQDGIVMINPSVVDGISAFQTLVHETGHFLGLFHTFEGGCQPGTWTNFGYTMSGDGVTDTPAHFGPTEDYIGSDSCWTAYVLDTCMDADGVDSGVDPVDNMMNFLTPTCWSQRGRFTDGQIERMLAAYEQYRSASAYPLSNAMNVTEYNAAYAGGGETTTKGKSNETLSSGDQRSNTTDSAAPVAASNRTSAGNGAGGTSLNRWSYLKGMNLALGDP